MLAFRVRIEIGDPRGERFESLEALVDTGSTYTWVAASLLSALGIEPEELRDFILADGRRAPYGIATALVRIDGRLKPTQVVFGEEDTEPLFGVVTLEEFGQGVDAVNERLVPTPGLLKRLKAAANGQTQAIADLEAAYRELRQAIDGLPDDRMTAVWFGDWSTKDILAHAASWDEYSTLDLQRVSRGHVPCLAAFKESEVDDWNAFLMRPRRLFPLPQVRFESEHWHQQLVDALKSLPEAMFAPGNMAAAFLAIAAPHYRDHAGNIREWRHQEGL